MNLSVELKERIICEDEYLEMMIELNGKRFLNTRQCELEYIFESSLDKKREKKTVYFSWGKNEARPVIIKNVFRKCDLYRIEFIQLRWKDLTGLYTVKKTIDDMEEFLVMPKKFSLENLNDQYQMVERQKSDPEYDGIREYHWGDKLSRIHWKVFAGKGELFVRRSEEEKVEAVNIVVSLENIKRNQYSDYFSIFYSVSRFFLDHDIPQNIYFGSSFMRLESIEQYEELFTKVFCEDLWKEISIDETDVLQISVSKDGRTVEDYVYDMEIG